MLVLHGIANAEEPRPPIDADLTEELLEAESDFHEDKPTKPAEGVTTGSLEPYTQKVLVDFHLNETCGDQGQVVGFVRYVEVDPAAGTRTTLYHAFECVDVPQLGDPGAAPLPAPHLVDIHERVSEQLPLPGVHIDPHIDGLTGLDTFLWHDDRATSRVDHDDDPSTEAVPGVEVTATAGPYTVTARAWIVEYRWETGDGATYSSPTAGSHDDPAATHVYDVKGDYEVVAETVWRGSYVWTATDGTSGRGDLGTGTRRSTRDYRVIEVRSVLVG